MNSSGKLHALRFFQGSSDVEKLEPYPQLMTIINQSFNPLEDPTASDQLTNHIYDVAPQQLMFHCSHCGWLVAWYQLSSLLNGLVSAL